MLPWYLYWRVCHVKNLLKKKVPVCVCVYTCTQVPGGQSRDVVKRITTNKTCGMSRHNR